jgi:hypothetical protein
MSSIEWVSPYVAVTRLENIWKIPLSDVEQIVRNVIEGGRVEVRAIRGYQWVSQIVTGQIQLLPGGLWAADYKDIEIDFKGLLKEGRKLIPSFYKISDIQMAMPPKQRSRNKRERAAEAISNLWPEGVPDPMRLTNGELCKLVSEKIAEDNRQLGLRPTDISDDTILRAAGRQL